MKEEKNFKEALREKKIPILVLDQKWHQLFSLGGKPENITHVEDDLTKLLERQGQLNNDLKDMKKLKKKLMGDIVANMEGTHAEKFGAKESKKLDENRRLIDELNEKMEQAEDELLELPALIRERNEELMLETVQYSYDKLHKNMQEAAEIAEWIAKVRKELKINIIKKQNREINGRQIYAYMHDIFGMEILNLFDLNYEEVEEHLDKKKKDNASNQSGESAGEKKTQNT